MLTNRGLFIVSMPCAFGTCELFVVYLRFQLNHFCRRHRAALFCSGSAPHAPQARPSPRQTHRTRRISGTAHSSHGGAAGTSPACGRAGSQHYCSPYRPPASPGWGSGPGKKSRGEEGRGGVRTPLGWWEMPRRQGLGEGGSSSLPLWPLHREAAGPGPGSSRQLHVKSLILISITRNPGASHPLSALNAQQLWEGGEEGRWVKPGEDSRCP